VTNGNDKFEITEVTHPEFPELHQIKTTQEWAERNNLSPMLGGWVEHEHNLLPAGTAWIHEGAIVRGMARVYEHAQVHRGAVVDGGYVAGMAIVHDHAKIHEGARLGGSVQVGGWSDIGGALHLTYGILHDYAWLRTPKDIMQLGPIGSENRVTVLHRSLEGGSGYEVRAGCWKGNVNMLRERVWPTADGDNVWYTPSSGMQYAREYLEWCDLMEQRIKSWRLSDATTETCDKGVWKERLKELQGMGVKAKKNELYG